MGIGRHSGWANELMNKLRELQSELKTVFSGRGGSLLDSFAPLLLLLIVNPLFGLNYALWASLILASMFALYRITQRRSLVYSLGGFGGVLLATVFVKLSGSEAGFFLPGLISGSVTVLLCVISVAVNRPLVAWTSFITRRWPLGWYWHPRVLPAYNEVTIMWAVAFMARLGLEFWLFQRGSLNELGTVRIVMGWPFTILLLVISYLYGLWRLGQLKGPSVDEFKSGNAPPWDGQRRGF